MNPEPPTRPIGLDKSATANAVHGSKAVEVPGTSDVQAPVPAPSRSLGEKAARAWASVPERVEQVVSDVVTLLGRVVHRLRTPLLLVALAPIVAGLAFVIIAATRGGLDLSLAVVLAVLGAVPGCWLGYRRHQLLGALQPPKEAAAEIYAALAPADIWAQVRTNLTQIAAAGSGLGPRALGRRMWRGVRLASALRNRFAEMPRLAPFLPGRLRGAGILVAWCLGSAVILAALAVLELATTMVRG